MSLLFLKAYGNLMLFDQYLARRDFAGLYRRVGNCPVHTGKSRAETLEPVLFAINMACIWYWKEVLCLQRSAATTCLLRQHGLAAQMVIGAQQLPFKAHAWVEVGGAVANDKPYTPEMYVVLDRC
jgi:Transglutaminase-like superfamily